jgi:HisJ family histidinol phosphate phosphatase
MFDIDQHTHTIYSKHSDARMTVANSLAAAARAGLRRYVVLEHVPEISRARPTIQEWAKGRNERVQLDQIAEDLKLEAPKYPGMQILRGVEVDADPFALDGTSMLDDYSGIDVVVGSTHIFPGGEAFWFEPIQLPPEAAMRVARTWLEWAVKFVRSGRVDILAHPADLVGARNLVPPFEHHSMIGFFDPLLIAMKECGVAFELNELLSSKLTLAHRVTYPVLVKRAKALGLKFSLCTDAHAPDKVGKYQWVRELVAGAGITEADLWQPRVKSS